jgi:hypothetical protein
MSYKIEENKIVFDEPPRAGEEIKVTVSTQQTLNGFADPRSYYPRRVNEVDTNRLAVNDLSKQHPVVNYKRKRVDDLTGEPETKFNAQYPFNHVRETESGHIQELDDTPGYERIHEYHRSGTFYEIHPDGTKVTKVVGEDFEIVHQNKSVRVRGDCKVYIDGDSEVYVRGSMNAQVDEDLNFNVGRNITFHAGKNIRMYSNESTEITAQQEITATSVSNMKLQTQANLDIAADGNYKTSIKGNTDFIGDGYGVFMYGDDINLITDAIMDINAGTTMNLTSSSAMDLVGSTIDFNKTGRAPAAALSAQDIIFKDSRGAVSYTDGEEIEEPPEAIVLPEKSLVELPDEGGFHGDDDVEKTEDELRAAIKDGSALPSKFSDYSYNGLEGNYNVNSAARTVLSSPPVPVDVGDHGSSDGTNSNENNEAAGNQNVQGVEQVTVTPSNGIDYSLQLSPSFTLGMISSRASFGHKIRPQHGLTSEQIINNLKNIAVNSLEPIKQQYPNMFVTSGFRPAKGTSQHERGMACDMQFRGSSKSEYHEIAVWIRANVPHDQLLLEYKNTGTGNPWIHLSLTPSSNRGQSMTFWNHSRYKNVGTFYNLA